MNKIRLTLEKFHVPFRSFSRSQALPKEFFLPVDFFKENMSASSSWVLEDPESSSAVDPVVGISLVTSTPAKDLRLPGSTGLSSDELSSLALRFIPSRLPCKVSGDWESLDAMVSKMCSVCCFVHESACDSKFHGQTPPVSDYRVSYLHFVNRPPKQSPAPRRVMHPLQRPTIPHESERACLLWNEVQYLTKLYELKRCCAKTNFESRIQRNTVWQRLKRKRWDFSLLMTEI